MINRRQLIKTATAFFAATQLPGIAGQQEDVLRLVGKDLHIDSPVLIDGSAFTLLEIRWCRFILHRNTDWCFYLPKSANYDISYCLFTGKNEWPSSLTESASEWLALREREMERMNA